MATFSREHLRTKLEGPVFPVLTPFTADGAVDHEALARYVDFLAGCKVTAVMSTVGTSRFNLLSMDEIKAVNETIAHAAKGRCIVILAGPMTGTTSVHVDFAKHAEKAGGDAFIAFFPERYYGQDAVVEFFKTISDSIGIGTMIHEMPMRSGYGGNQQYALDLLERLTDMPGVVGMKEECMDGGYAYLLHRRLSGKCGIIGAGSKRLYMRDFHAGAKAYLVGIGNVFPQVAKDFYAAMRAHDMDRAHAIVRAYEDPYFDLAVSLGWHVALKETLHMMNLMPPYERAPLPRLTAVQREKLAACVDKLGWRGRDPAHGAVM
jgi:dihydrodipicolinate synthase/N-acetylneuraminate lyase